MVSELRPLTIGELLDRAITLYVRKFGALLAPYCAVWGAGLACSAFVLGVTGKFALIAVPATLIANNAVIVTAAALLDGAAPVLRAAVSRGARLWLRTLAAVVLLGLVACTIVLVAGFGVALNVAVAVALVSVVVEDANPLRAVDHALQRTFDSKVPAVDLACVWGGGLLLTPLVLAFMLLYARDVRVRREGTDLLRAADASDTAPA